MKRYEQVVQRVRKLVSAGTLRPGQQAPSVRAMAEQTGFSLMTVLDAYRRLENAGLLAARERAGYFVRPERFWREGPSAALPPTATEPTATLTARSVELDDQVAELLAAVSRPGVLPLGAGVPAPESFPSEPLSLSMSRVVRSDPMGVNRYSLTPGEPDLRRELALRMVESGCTVSADDVLVTGGATDGLIVALRALAGPGDTIAVESPGYFGFYRAAMFLGLKVVEIPSDPQTGLNVDALRRVLRRRSTIRCLLVCPGISNPTGAAMRPDARRDLVETGREYDLPIVEDDTYGDLFFGQRRPSSLKALDAEGVIQIGGLGKTLCPGYRIGWLAGGRLHAEITRLHGMAYLSVARPNQLAVARFLASGGMAKHLRTIRAAYEDSVQVFRLAVANAFGPETRTSDPRGGHFLWVQMPEGADATALAHEAIRRKISIAPGAVFGAGRRHTHCFRLNCAVPWSDRVEAAIRTLGKLAAGRTVTRSSRAPRA